MELAVIGMTVDGQTIGALQGAMADDVEADKVFLNMEKQAKWHPAVTKYFRVECELETLHDSIRVLRFLTLFFFWGNVC